ncbi:MAG TPA: TraR/DksA C4-type zinc finger protein [Patescibacteria group bacterium]|nr:TraR/DksA C4-type zinc finger protein [Patescibacteria group bacterium]
MQSFPSEILDNLRKHLEEDKKNINDRIAQLTAQDPFSDPDRVNDNAASDSEASEESSHDRFAALVEELNKKLSDIDAALLRIADGTYGFCTNCKQMIDTDRLAILPTATLCSDCEHTKKTVLQVK